MECFAGMGVGVLLLLLMGKARTQREMETFMECNDLVGVYMT